MINRKNKFKIILLVTASFLMPLLMLGSSRAAPLPLSELEALNTWTNWVGTNCSSSSVSSACCTSGSVITLVGNDNIAKAYNFFLQKGLSPAQSAGIVANLYNESSVNPSTSGTNPTASPAFGIAQWTPGSKFATDLNYLEGQGYIPTGSSPIDLGVQLEVLWEEINGIGSTSGGYPTNIIQQLKQINDPSQAAIFFRDSFERCNMSYNSCSDRGSVGLAVYQQYSNQGVGSISLGTLNSGCQNQAISAQCQSATGDTMILCEANKFNGIYYDFGGGHQGIQNFLASCPDPTNPPASPANQPTGGPNGGNPNPCATDCSGLVSIAVDMAFNQNYDWIVGNNGKMQDMGSSNGAGFWKSVPISQAQPGDIVTLPQTANTVAHVEIVVSVDNAKDQIVSFGSRDTGLQTGQGNPTSLSYWKYAYHWTGPGNNGN